MMRRSVTAALGAVALALTLAACSPAEEPSAENTPATQAPAEEATTAPSAEPTAEESTPVPFTCESMISPTLVQTFTDQGWASTESAFSVEGHEVEDGMLCVWGLPDTLTGQMYAYGAVNKDLSAQMQKSLKDNKWMSEKTEAGVYFTAPAVEISHPSPSPSSTAPATTRVDVMGGFTYLFGDGWVKFSDSRDGILLISGPQG